MKKILLVGDGNHQLLTTYSIWLKKLNPSISLDILSFKKVDKENSYTNVFPIKIPSYLSFHPKVRSLFFYIRIYYLYLSLFKSYDYIHFHMASPSIRYLISKKCRAKKILTFWGSDFYKAGNYRRKLLKHMIASADEVTCTNPQMAIDICDTFDIKRTFKIITYIIQPLEEIEKITLSDFEIKNKIGIQTDSIVLTVGSNNNFNQNHIDILNQLIKIEKLNEKVFVIVPLTYGRAGKTNIDKINQFLVQNKFNFRLITKYMNDQDVAHLRRITDIFIQLQSSDQLSGAMTEHMFAGNIVITGAWLPYGIFKENKVHFQTVDAIADLPDILEYNLANMVLEKASAINNSKIIKGMFGAENAILRWSSLYN